MDKTIQIITLVLSGFNSLVVIILGFFAFFSNRKIAWIKGELYKENYAFSVRFKTEFDTYKYLWLKAAHFVRAARICYQPGLRATAELNTPDTLAVREMLEVRLRPMMKELFEVKETVLNNMPFISEDVRAKAHTLVEIVEYPGGPYAEEFGERIEKNLSELQKAIEEQAPKLKKRR